MRTFSHRATLALAIALSLSTTAQAQQQNSPDGAKANAKELDAVVVQGVRIQGYAAQVTNVGLKLPVSQRETPQSVSVLTRSLLDDLAVGSLDDAILFVPGVAMRQYDSIDTQYISRGFEITNYQLDGLPATLGRAKPRLAMYDRIEVLRGAAGLLNGAGEPGGAINLVRKRPTKDFAADASFRIGSWDLYQVQGDIRGALIVGQINGELALQLQTQIGCLLLEIDLAQGEGGLGGARHGRLLGWLAGSGRSL